MYKRSQNQHSIVIKALWIHNIHFHVWKQFQRNHRKLLLVDSDGMPSTGHQSTRFVWLSEASIEIFFTLTIKHWKLVQGNLLLRSSRKNSTVETLLKLILKVKQFKTEVHDEICMKFTLSISARSCIKREAFAFFIQYLPAISWGTHQPQ